MAIRSKDEIGKLCVAAALTLCIAHILTMIGTEYQVYAEYRDGWSFSGFPSGDLLQVFTGVLVNYGTFLSPVILLLIVRRFCVLVGVIAFPVAVFFVLRVHHVWEFYWFGINSMAGQKGDALGWCTLIFDMISAAIVAPVLLGLLIEKLIGGLQGRRTGQAGVKNTLILEFPPDAEVRSGVIRDLTLPTKKSAISAMPPKASSPDERSDIRET